MTLERGKKRRPAERLFVRLSISAWLLYLVVVIGKLQSACSFLHPIRLLRAKHTKGPKVPLVSKNGDNYRVYFRSEVDNSDEVPSNKVGLPPLRRDLASNKVRRRERAAGKKRSKGKDESNGLTAEASESNGLLQNAESASPAPDEESAAPLCRVVTLSDGKIPTSESSLPESLFGPPHVLRKLDGIYHAMSHQETRRLDYVQVKNDPFKPRDCDEAEERKLVSVTRTSLEDAGFQLLTRRDLDLCDALNAGYLLRLSIVPDVSELDGGIAKEFYPEFYNDEGEFKNMDELLFEGKVMVFWRGYSQEVSRGRLLLPKLDYLQASLIQRAAAWLRRKLDSAERTVVTQLDDGMRKVTAATIHASRAVADRCPNKPLARALRTSLRASTVDLEPPSTARRSDPFFKLSRYGGSKIRFVGSPNPTDSVNPFVICEESGGSEECNFSESDEIMYDCLNHSGLKCPYDVKMAASGKQLPPMQLLERVTMSNLVDPFSKEGRQNFLKSFFSKSELVEPTYEEVVVIWRQKEDEHEKLSRPVWTPPRLIYELADMFDFSEKLPTPLDPHKRKKKRPLQIRTFDGVPMSNLPAVMPKTKLVFRPADAFVFDLISVVSLSLALGSLKFTSPKLDILAFVSVSLWIVRLIIRYSNKLARYDLLVKKFLTSKISHRNAGALKYLLAEAGEQRAARAALVHTWLCRQGEDVLDRSTIVNQGMMEVNDVVRGKQVNVDIGAALDDLQNIGFVSCNGDKVTVARDDPTIVERIRNAWNSVLEDRITLSRRAGRQDRR